MTSPLRRSLLLSCSCLLAAAFGCSGSKPQVVLYCAQDQEFAQSILADFTKQTGWPVAPCYDTEKEKSVALYEQVKREAGRPRCDVHWNNEILSTILLQRLGLLEPYASPSAEPFLPGDKASDHTWHAFAARARVLLVNTNLVPEAERPRSLLDLTGPRWKGRVGMAKPLYGTSLTQAACLFEVLGPAEAKRFYHGLRENGVAVVSGNKDVARGVSAGQFAVGMTDTDDAIGEVEAGRPVAIVFPDAERPAGDRLGTLFIPNTVAIIRDCRHPEAARRLVDFLLSPEVETKLAQSASRQIPLNPNVKLRPHDQIETPGTIKKMDVDFARAADLWEEVETFLRQEFDRP